MIFNMNKEFTPDELTVMQNKDLSLTGDVFLQTSKEPNYANETSNKVGEANKDLGTTKKIIERKMRIRLLNMKKKLMSWENTEKQ